MRFDIAVRTMKFFEQKIKGVWLIEQEPFVDERGEFRRHFCQREFDKKNIDTTIRQANISENKCKYTLRGFHFQIRPFQESKTLSCLQGAIYDIVVDLRGESKTFLKWMPFEINSGNKLSLHVPAGCANAYLTLSASTAIHYYMSEFYVPDSYGGFRYNDPFFNFTWPAEPRVISKKDKNHPDFDPHCVRT